MRRFALALGLIAVAVPFAAARAQNSGQRGNGDTTGMTTSDSTATAAPTATDSSAPTTTAARPATGYGYSDPKPAPGHLAIRSGHPAVHHAVSASGPVATLPGFEMLGENGSRLFVDLTQTVQVEERHARGVLTYVLKGARVMIRNNENALVTVHFNTPVSRARLVPSGRDLLFIIDLRAPVTPTWKMNPGKEGSAVLTIDFPKGSYVSNTEQ